MLRSLSAFALALLPLPLLAFAQSQPRMTTAEEQAAWPMIGRVNIKGIGSRRMCTGTLIAPDQVLTAAHCLDLPPGRGTEDVIFVAGWRQGVWIADRAAKRIEMHPRRPGPRPPSARAAATDIALLHLERPILEVPPLELRALPPDVDRVDILAYRADRPHALSLQSGCPIFQRSEGLLVTGCPVVPGSSGGPLLWRDGEDWGIAGVVSTTSRVQSTASTVAPWPAP